MTKYTQSKVREVIYLLNSVKVEDHVRIEGGEALDEYLVEHSADVVRIAAVPQAFIDDFVHGFARRLLDLAAVIDDKGNITLSGVAEHFHSPADGWELDAYEYDDASTLRDVVGTWAMYHHTDLLTIVRENFAGRDLPYPAMVSAAYQLGGIAASDADGRGQGFVLQSVDSVAARRLSHYVTADLAHVTATYDRDGGDAYLSPEEPEQVRLYGLTDETGTTMSETVRCAEHRESGVEYRDVTGNDAVECQECGAVSL